MSSPLSLLSLLLLLLHLASHSPFHSTIITRQCSILINFFFFWKWIFCDLEKINRKVNDIKNRLMCQRYSSKGFNNIRQKGLRSNKIIFLYKCCFFFSIFFSFFFILSIINNNMWYSSSFSCETSGSGGGGRRRRGRGGGG